MNYLLFFLSLLIPLQGFSQTTKTQTEKLFDILNQEKNIDNTVARLDEIDTGLRKNFVLIYRSLSAQGASAEFPRALLFNNDASLVVAFNGHASQTGNNALEVVEFSNQTKKFTFRELKLISDLQSHSITASISEPNPQTCVRCHQDPGRIDVNPRPNWEPHNLWPGTYGSIDGLAGYANWYYSKNNTQSLEEIISLQRNTTVGVIQNNAINTEEFNLIDRELTQEASSYYDFWQRYQKKELPKRYLSLKAKESHSLLFPDPQTQYFTRALADRNFERVTEIVSQLPEFPLLQELMRSCMATDNFKLQDKEQLFQASPDFFMWHKENTKNRFRKNVAEQQNTSNDSTGKCFEWIFESIGYNTSDWSMDYFSGGRFAKNGRFGTPDYPRTDFLSIFGKRYPKPNRLLSPDGKEIFNESDDVLQRAQKVAIYFSENRGPLLSSFKTRLFNRDNILLSSGELAPAAYGQCIRCHAAPSLIGAPAIPYNDISALRRMGPQIMEKTRTRLALNAPGDMQMPIDSPLSSAEKKSILKFLENNL